MENNWKKIKTHLTEPISIISVAISFGIVGLLFKQAAISYPQAFLIFIGLSILILILLLIIKLLESMDEIKSFATRITYHNVYGKNGEDEIFEITDKIIRNAQHEILILNWRIEERPDANTINTVAREKYFTDLFEKCEKNKITYKRVIQSHGFSTKNNSKRIPDKYHESYIRHFKEMLELQKKQKQNGINNISLLIAPPTVPATLVIVDGRHLIWQLTEIRDPSLENPEWKMRGAVVVDDPGKTFINNFIDTFKKVSEGEHRSLSQADLTKT